MARPVIFTNRNEDILVDVERGGKPLGEDVHDVVIAIRTIVEVNAKRVLPFLRLEDVVGVWRVKDKTLKVQFADASQLGSRFESHVPIVADAISALEKTDFRIKARTYFAVLPKYFQPGILIGDSGAEICLAGRNAGRSCLGGIASDHNVFVEDQSSVCTAGLIAAVK